MFASTHPQDFPPAILSRLQRYDVRRLTVPEIEGKLNRILDAEAIEAEPAAVELIARLAAGGMRDAESMLDQLLGSAGRIDEVGVRELLGLAEAEAVDRLVTALVDGDAVAGIAVLDELEDRGRDVGVVLDQVIEVIRARLSACFAPDGDTGAMPALTRVARRLAEIDPERRGVGGLRLQLELAIFAGAAVGGGAETARSTAPVPVFAPRTESVASRPDAHPRPPTDGSGSTGQPRVSDQPARRRGSPTAASSTDSATAPPVVHHPVDAPSSDPAEVEPSSDSPAADPPAAVTGEPDSVAAAPPEPAVTAEPEPAAAAPPAGRPAGAPSDRDGLDELRARWPEIVEHISKHPPTKPLIAACRPISVESNVVTLGFPEGQSFLRDVAERRRANLEEGIGRFLGRAVAVRCVATNLDLVPPVPGDDEENPLFAEARRIFADDLADVGEVS
jgi:DNA polymerase-3 subunit gamma/tau